MKRWACGLVVVWVVGGTLASLQGEGPRGAGPVVRVKFDAGTCAHPVSGRLVVLMKRRDVSRAADRRAPIDGPFWEEEQPLFALDVKDLAPGAWVEVGAGAAAFPEPMDRLEPGTYDVQARLDTQRLDSDWKREPGNLYSKGRAVLEVKPGEQGTAEVELDAVTSEPTRSAVDGVEWFSVRSELLSAFREREVVLRAGVVLPAGYDPKVTYAAVYEVPGFGGNDQDAVGRARRIKRSGGEGIARSAFWVVLDPEGPNGHTLFVDSDNNGPCGRALVEELIPALEKKYPLVAQPAARVLRGHSSGGWSTLWLATEYPATFGACWSSSPDPVDFRRFQLTDLYAAHWFYGFPVNGLRSTEAHEAEQWARKVPQGVIPAGASEGPAAVDRLVSYRRDGRAVMTVEREARGEDVLGPDNTSGQQWDSWFAAWGPRNERGNPAALFDPATGLIDRGVADRYRRYDIADRLRRDPGQYGPLFAGRIRLVVGDADNFFLNEAVSLLKKDVDGLAVARGTGYIKVVAGKDHSSVFNSDEVRAFEDEMADHLREAGLLKDQSP
ncbi:MAG TPA: alpha/beta hydrolase-fold protein [Phycisphaerales bacterium]|nr:alpha/beta hydrolase-fold protein [Phycisphaerales bacterium]